MSDLPWTILDTGRSSAEENMRLDAHLLETLDAHKKPILHLYEWSAPSATYGHFVKPAEFLDLKAADELGIDLAKRSTGGGIVFHIWDLAFSVLVPASHPYFSENTLENYAFVNDAVLAAASSFLLDSKELSLISKDAPAPDPACKRFCMAMPTKYDVVLEGKKIAGAAQRKTKKGFLHQGTIALKMPDRSLLERVLLPGTKVLESTLASTYPLLGEGDDLEKGRAALREELQTHLTKEKSHVTKS